MIKKFFTLLIFLNISFSLGAEESNSSSWQSWPWKKKNKTIRTINVVNDIPQLIKDLSEETKELQDAIYFTLDVNGVTVEPGKEAEIPVCEEKITITVKSKKPLSDIMDPDSKDVVKKVSSWFAAYYGFVCTVSPEIDTIHLAIPVSHGCDALQRKQPYKLSYRWPRGILISLAEIIDFD